MWSYFSGKSYHTYMPSFIPQLTNNFLPVSNAALISRKDKLLLPHYVLVARIKYRLLLMTSSISFSQFWPRRRLCLSSHGFRPAFINSNCLFKVFSNITNKHRNLLTVCRCASCFQCHDSIGMEL